MSRAKNALKKTTGFNSFYPKVKIYNEVSYTISANAESVSLEPGAFILEPPDAGFGIEYDFIYYPGYLIKYLDTEDGGTEVTFTSWRTTFGSQYDNFLVLDEFTTPETFNSGITIVTDAVGVTNYTTTEALGIQENQPVIVNGKVKFMTYHGVVIEVSLDGTSIATYNKLPSSGIGSAALSGIIWTENYGAVVALTEEAEAI